MSEQSIRRPFEDYELTFRSHYRRIYGNRGFPYDRYRDAYRFGFSLAQEHCPQGSSWAEVCDEARVAWQGQHDFAWEDVHEAIQEGWSEGCQEVKPI